MKITKAMFAGDMIPLLRQFERENPSREWQEFNHWLADFCGWLGEKQSCRRTSRLRSAISAVKQCCLRFLPVGKRTS